MRTIGIFAVLLVSIGWILGTRYCYTCTLNKACGNSTEVVTDDDASARGKNLSFAVDNKPVYSGFDQFAFTGDGNKALDLNDNNEAFLDSVTAYLNRFPNSKVEIIGRFFKGEAGAGFLDNAGLVRADLIRQELKKRGIDVDNRVDINSEQLGADVKFDEPILFAGTAGELAVNEAETLNAEGSLPEGDESEVLEKAKFTFTNMTFSDVSFESGSAVFEPVPQFINYADSVVLFLKENPDKKIKIIGHTDSDGGDEMNMALGRNRARSVRQFMMDKYGLKKDQIDIDSKGETKPVATNATEDGKRRNRRVNIQII
ncbi:MAG: OmpA family protein [Bacteroidota bacterium]